MAAKNYYPIGMTNRTDNIFEYFCLAYEDFINWEVCD